MTKGHNSQLYNGPYGGPYGGPYFGPYGGPYGGQYIPTAPMTYQQPPNPWGTILQQPQQPYPQQGGYLPIPQRQYASLPPQPRQPPQPLQQNVRQPQQQPATRKTILNIFHICNKIFSENYF